jgi:hypothetical protein
MPYDMTEHRHRFAAWAAARAVQRGWGSSKTEKLRNALASCGVREFVGSPESPYSIDERSFRELHRQWCRSVIESLTQQGVADATFGRAAKLVAVYLKVMVVLGPDGDCNLARVVHPPIDRTELQKVAADVGDSPHKRLWRTVSWTQLTEENYYSLIDQLRTLIPSSHPFWTLEQYWDVADNT